MHCIYNEYDLEEVYDLGASEINAYSGEAKIRLKQ
jgi:hypothetical protein